MEQALESLREHGYWALFVSVLLEQLGVPIPSIPLLLAAGALVGLGYLSPIPVILIVLLACLIGDLLWYELGRRKGASILKLLCRVSLEPESCIRTTEGVFDRYGIKCLLFAKFVPGLYTVTPPVAGMVGLKLRRFVIYDTLGILIYTGVFTGLGLVMRNQLEWLLFKVETWGASIFQVVLLILGVNLAYKFILRQRFVRSLRAARITAEELKQMLDGGEEVMIADLRHSSEIKRERMIIPGARVVPLDEIDRAHERLPRDRDIILYCS